MVVNIVAEGKLTIFISSSIVEQSVATQDCWLKSSKVRHVKKQTNVVIATWQPMKNESYWSEGFSICTDQH
jgi:hypothetical protein